MLFYIVAVDCGPPDLPSAGFGGLEMFYDNTTFNNTAYYNCSDEALTLVGEEERICQADGTWSGEAPYCRSNMRIQWQV